MIARSQQCLVKNLHINNALPAGKIFMMGKK